MSVATATATTTATYDPRVIAALAALRVQRQAAGGHPPFVPHAGQAPPTGDWRVWLILAGRGFGKTRAAVEHVHERVRSHVWRRIALVGATAADVRDVMVEGESGLLACARPGERPRYYPSMRRVEWPNGARATLFSADEPDRLRGPQHDGAWADEIAAWRYPAAWDMLMLGLRVGSDPRCVATTTPKPVALVRSLMAAPTTSVTRGTTHDNAANLSAPFLAEVVSRYAGTRLGRQEIEGELLDDVPGALWTMDLLDAAREPRPDDDAWPALLASLRRVVVGVDPSGHHAETGNEAGVITVGERTMHGVRHYVVLDDASHPGSPNDWACAALDAAERYRADAIVAERNFGGEMVRATIHGAAQASRRRAPRVTLPVASRGKWVRAEPVAALYEQRRVHHLGVFPRLEEEMRTFVPGGPSPNRMDALVWAITDLMDAPSMAFRSG